jgi:DNA-binding MurR/RpiR family transcriptional regulator
MDTPRDFDSLKTALAARRDGLPRRLQQVAAFAIEHPDEVAFGTAASIALRAQVQPSTLVRFAKALGYSGFSDLQSVFRNRLRDGWPDYRARLASLNGAPAGRDPVRLLHGFAEASSVSLERLRVTTTTADLEAAVDLLASAETIFLLGMRRAFPVAAYLAYALPRLGVRAMLVDQVGDLGSEQISNAGPKDALVAVSFSPYTPATINGAKRAAAQGVPVVAITDSLFSPLAASASVRFDVAEADFGAFRPLSATFCLAMTLAVAVGERRGAPPPAM